MLQNIYSEANSSSTIQVISRISCETQLHYCVQYSPCSEPYESTLHHPSYSFTIHFNIISLFIHMTSKCSPSSGLTAKKKNLYEFRCAPVCGTCSVAFDLHDFIPLTIFDGDRGGTVVKVLCYKSVGRWFDSRWCDWKFH